MSEERACVRSACVCPRCERVREACVCPKCVHTYVRGASVTEERECVRGARLSRGERVCVQGACADARRGARVAN